MALNALTLEDLRKLNDTVTSLVMAGFRLEQDGLSPIFDLSPGGQMRITLDAVMPEAYASFRPAVRDADLPSFLKPVSTEAAPPADGAEPVDPPPALGEVAGGDHIPSAPEQSVAGQPETATPVSAPQDDPQPVTRAAEGSGGGVEVAAPATPAAPVPGSASAMAATWQAPMWSPEEDARLINLVVKGMTEHGLSRNRAMMEAARELGRAAEGVKFRCYNKLKARIEAALETVRLSQSPASVPDAGEPPNPLSEDDALAFHLPTLTDKGGWTLQRDLELMDLSCQGWPVADIAREINMPDTAVKPRFDALTGLHDDAITGKKARRWTREEVLGALLVLAGKVDAA